MADVEGEIPDFEDFHLPEDDLAAEPGAEAAPPLDWDAEPPVPEGGMAALEEAEKKEKEEEAEAEKQPTRRKERQEAMLRFLKSLPHANPYTVFLGMALLALVIAICCLLLELGRYGFSIRASGRGGAFLWPVAQSGPANTIAAA